MSSPERLVEVPSDRFNAEAYTIPIRTRRDAFNSEGGYFLKQKLVYVLMPGSSRSRKRRPSRWVRDTTSLFAA